MWVEIHPTPDFDTFENLLSLWEQVHGRVVEQELKMSSWAGYYKMRQQLLPARILGGSGGVPGFVWEVIFKLPSPLRWDAVPVMRWVVNLTRRSVKGFWEYREEDS